MNDIEAARKNLIGRGAKVSEVESSVLGDRTRLQQALWNLLSNALKFTPGPVVDLFPGTGGRRVA